MSFDRITELLSAARHEDAATARRLRVQADDLAASTEPGIVCHVDGGPPVIGQIIGVTADGQLKVTFGDSPVLLDPDRVEAL